MSDKNLAPAAVPPEENNIMGIAPIPKLLAKFAIPSVISMLVNSIYNLVDQIFIGQGVGYLGNAATNVVFPFVTIAMAISLMISVGTAANVGLNLGGKDQDCANLTLATALPLPCQAESSSVSSVKSSWFPCCASSVPLTQCCPMPLITAAFIFLAPCLPAWAL